MHILGQIFLYGALQSNAIQCLILTAQATDEFILDMLGKTCGLSMEFRWICISQTGSNISPSPFGNQMMLFTIGLLFTLLLAIPFFYFDLDKSVYLTVAAAFMAMIVAITWVTASIQNGLDPNRMPAITPFSVNYVETMPVVMLNLGCATVIPSWINIKSNRVHSQSVLWTSLGVSSLFYVVIGIFFALGFDIIGNNSLQALIEAAVIPPLCKVSVAFYAYFMLLPSVPVNFLISQSNLLQNNVAGKKTSIFLAFILPIIVAIPLQTGNYIFIFLSWTSIIFVSFVNFILPLFIYLECVEFRARFKNRVLTIHQLKLLAIIHHRSIEIEEYLKENETSSPLLTSDGGPPQIVLTEPTPSTKPAIDENDPDQVNARPSIDEIFLGQATILRPNLMILKRHELARDKVEIDEYARITLRAAYSTSAAPPTVRLQDMQWNTPPAETTEIELSAPQSATGNTLAVPDNTRLSSSVSSYSAGNALSVPDNLQRSSNVSSHSGTRPKYPALNKLTFIDPINAGVPSDWIQDLPDPDYDEERDNDIEFPLSQSENSNSVPNLLDPQVTIKRQGSTSQSMVSSAGSGFDSLPRERQFKCPPFRALPKSFPIEPVFFCKVLLFITVWLTVINIVSLLILDTLIVT